MKDLAIHPKTKQNLEYFRATPSHALLLVAPTGSGKSSVARELSARLLHVEKLSNYPYAMVLTAESGLGIESIRQLERFLSLKVPVKSSLNQIALIEDSQAMTLEAQNALLKTLEEPPTGTLVIMTVNHAQALLPTVRSRTQMINIMKPDRKVIDEYFNKDYNPSKVAQSYSISGGLPGLMTALLERSDHPLLEATEEARQWLRTDRFSRLAMADSLSRKKDLAADMVFILQQMAHVSLQSATGPAAKRWQTILAASFEASEQLLLNAQPKLVLSNLALEL